MADKKYAPKEKKSKGSSASIQSSLEGRIPPQAIEMERAVLGAIMSEKDAYGSIASMLAPESFYVHAHELIYEAIRSLEQQQKPIDMLTVTEELRRTDNLDSVGGAAYIAELTMNIGGAANLEYHAHIVANKALSRNLISFASEVVTQAYEDTVEIDIQMQEAEAKLFDLSRHNIQKDYQRADTLTSLAIEEILEAGNKADGISGIASGFPEIDKITSGWQNSDLIIIAARPAMGKTAFVLSMAKNIAIDQGIPTAVFNLEMSNLQIIKRIMSNVCEIQGDKLKSGRLQDHEWAQLNAKISLMEEKPLFIDDTSGLSIFEFRSKARRLVKEHGVRLIIVDYLQLMSASGMGLGNREQEVSTISRSLKILAKELNIPIIALSQLNRGVENRQGDANSKRPQLSDLRESGAIEQDADIVCFIHRPEVYKIYTDPEDNSSTKGVAYFIIAKHRNGSTDDVKLAFRGEFAKFAPIESLNFIHFDSSLNSSGDFPSFGSNKSPF